MVFRLYLLDNDEIVISGYDDICDDTLDKLDNFVNECCCERSYNVITGDPEDMMDLLVSLSQKYDILL